MIKVVLLFFCCLFFLSAVERGKEQKDAERRRRRPRKFSEVVCKLRVRTWAPRFLINVVLLILLACVNHT